MANLKQIREYLWNNGFRYVAYLNGDHVTVDDPSSGIWKIYTARQAKWLVRNFA